MAPNLEILYIQAMHFHRFCILAVLAFSCALMLACSCASTDHCAEEWYGPTDGDSMNQKNAKCLDQEKYDSCLSRYMNAQNPDVEAQCHEEALYVCKDRLKRK
jgi:hypothetical protein